MSQFTDYAENRLVDFIRGQALSLPGSWYVVGLSSASDSAPIEVAGSTRTAVPRSLDAWAGTQGAGSVLASSGSSKVTSNNTAITIAAGSATATHVGFFDAASGGSCWMYAPLTAPVTAGNPIELDAGELMLSLGLSGGARTYLVNKMIDLLFRQQAFTYPTSVHLGAYAAGGSEVGGGVGYSRVALASTLTALSGTQGAGTTAASSGTTGRTSNNALLTFDAPTGSWGVIDRLGVFDAASGGNELWRASLASPKSIGVGSPLTFPANSIGFTWA